MSAIHPSHRRVRHLRQIVCRGIRQTDPEGCFYVISSQGKELYCSGVARDCQNPQWDALPLRFLDEHSNVVSFTFKVLGWGTSEVLFSSDIDMRSLQFLNKTFAGLPNLKPAPTVLFRCQDGVYDTSGAAPVPEDDWVVVKDVTTSSSRQERHSIDGVQSTGMVLAALKIQLEMMQHKFEQIKWEADSSIPSAADPSTRPDLESEINRKSVLVVELRKAVAERKALHAHRASVIQSQSSSTHPAVSGAPVGSRELGGLVKARRIELIASLRDIFSVNDTRINGSLLPDREGLPETNEHAIALGHVVHLLGIVCEIAALTPPHPMLICGDHSRIAERHGLPLEMYIPLYPAKGTDKVRQRKGVELLRGNVLYVAAAVTMVTVNDVGSFGQILNRILTV